MKKRIRVTLTIEVNVDREYSAEDHAKDILTIARKTFPVAQVNVLSCEINDPAGEPLVPRS